MPCAKCVSAVQGVEKLLLRVYTYTACGHGCFEMKKRDLNIQNLKSVLLEYLLCWQQYDLSTSMHSDTICPIFMGLKFLQLFCHTND